MGYDSSVKELLNTKYMKNITKVLAGKEGLEKIVRWVHVLEIRDVVEQCVNGNEMVLTTGIGYFKRSGPSILAGINRPACFGTMHRDCFILPQSGSGINRSS
jgi:hypothetical protein